MYVHYVELWTFIFFWFHIFVFLIIPDCINCCKHGSDKQRPVFLLLCILSFGLQKKTANLKIFKNSRDVKTFHQLELKEKLFKKKNGDGDTVEIRFIDIKKGICPWFKGNITGHRSCQSSIAFCCNLCKHIKDRFPKGAFDLASAYLILSMLLISFLSRPSNLWRQGIKLND